MPTKPFTNTLLVTIILFVFSSCNDKKNESAETDKKTNEQAFDLAAVKKSVIDANQSLVDLLKKGDSTTFANFYCSDAKIMAPEGPAVSGRDAIRSLIGSFVSIGLTDMTLNTIDVWGNESLVGEEGTCRFEFKDGKEYDHGKYIVLWKMEDGKWKLFRDIFNSDVAPKK